jgi:hypothetical protein
MVDLWREESAARDQWRAGKRGALRDLKAAVTALPPPERSAYGIAVLEHIDDDLAIATESRISSRHTEDVMAGRVKDHDSPPGVDRRANLAAMRKDGRDHSSSARFWQILGKWMASWGWIQDSPVLHMTEHPGEVERLRFIYDMSKQEQRKYMKQQGDLPRRTRAWDPRYQVIRLAKI